jgi:hypothetical protein
MTGIKEQQAVEVYSSYGDPFDGRAAVRFIDAGILEVKDVNGC